MLEKLGGGGRRTSAPGPSSYVDLPLPMHVSVEQWHLFGTSYIY